MEPASRVVVHSNTTRTHMALSPRLLIRYVQYQILLVLAFRVRTDNAKADEIRLSGCCR